MRRRATSRDGVPLALLRYDADPAAVQAWEARCGSLPQTTAADRDRAAAWAYTPDRWDTPDAWAADLAAEEATNGPMRIAPDEPFDPEDT